MVVLRLTLIVTFTEGITRWVQSWSQELTNWPPNEERAWDSSALRSFSKHEEHTLKFSNSTLTEHNTRLYLILFYTINAAQHKYYHTFLCYACALPF